MGNTRVCKYGVGGFLLRKNGCSGPFCRVAAAFCIFRPASPSRIAPRYAFRDPTEYCLWMPYGNPVRIRNNRPLLCFSQRASGIHRVFHALTGECSLIDPYLRVDLVALSFLSGKATRRKRRDASDTRRKEGLGGGPSTQQVCTIGASAHKKRLRQYNLLPDQGLPWSLAQGVGVCRTQSAQREATIRKE